MRELNIFKETSKKREIWDTTMNEKFEKAKYSQKAYEEAINMLIERYQKDPSDDMVKKYFLYLRQIIWPKTFVNNSDVYLMEKELSHVPTDIQEGLQMLKGLKANYGKYHLAFSSDTSNSMTVLSKLE